MQVKYKSNDKALRSNIVREEMKGYPAKQSRAIAEHIKGKAYRVGKGMEKSGLAHKNMAKHFKTSTKGC